MTMHRLVEELPSECTGKQPEHPQCTPLTGTLFPGNTRARNMNTHLKYLFLNQCNSLAVAVNWCFYACLASHPSFLVAPRGTRAVHSLTNYTHTGNAVLCMGHRSCWPKSEGALHTYKITCRLRANLPFAFGVQCQCTTGVGSLPSTCTGKQQEHPQHTALTRSPAGTQTPKMHADIYIL